ncbi:unnamed protein product [Protopolystoma xenopodis]|uniref:Uncharacterized protein n=1 Tax=Protopolystoma xenopodis TaxID=117903 RepID=A0A3S4ZTB2_9PLAT|nr:unnamed protein product [Protopolystoma xenopodis]
MNKWPVQSCSFSCLPNPLILPEREPCTDGQTCCRSETFNEAEGAEGGEQGMDRTSGQSERGRLVCRQGSRELGEGRASEQLLASLRQLCASYASSASSLSLSSSPTASPHPTRLTPPHSHPDSANPLNPISLSEPRPRQTLISDHFHAYPTGYPGRRA